MDDPKWISVDAALLIHQEQLARHGGQDGTRDLGLLESAIGRRTSSRTPTRRRA